MSDLPTGVTLVNFTPSSSNAAGNTDFTDSTLTLAVAGAVDEHTYEFTVTLSDGSSTFSSTGSLYVSPRALNVQASVSDQTYDGDANAINGNGSVSFSDDRESGDVFTISYTTALFSDKDVGDEKLVTVRKNWGQTTMALP